MSDNPTFIAPAKCQNCCRPFYFKTPIPERKIDLLDMLNHKCLGCGENVIQVVPMEGRSMLNDNEQKIIDDIYSMSRDSTIPQIYRKMTENAFDLICNTQNDIDKLETLIQKHNGECDFMCNPDACGYSQYHPRLCPNCPKQWKIEKESSDG